MGENTNIEMVALSEIRDLGWPTDPQLVTSFRKTLQSGGQIPLLLVNRVWHDDATWHYEIIDGFHRYEAAKTEGRDTVQCQVVEYDIETARYNRALACLGKPAEVTRERAILALKEAFVSEVVAKLGEDVIIYEPVLDEYGQVTKRRRKEPIPTEPMEALQVLTDHLAIREDVAPTAKEEREKMIGGHLFKVWEDVRKARWHDWEKTVMAWMERMMDAFGLSREWLRREVLRSIDFGKSDVMEKDRVVWEYIPDVDIRCRIIALLHTERFPSVRQVVDFAMYTGMARRTFYGYNNQTFRQRPCLAKTVIMKRLKNTSSLSDALQILKREYDAWNLQQQENEEAERARKQAQERAIEDAKRAEAHRKGLEILEHVLDDEDYALSRTWMSGGAKSAETKEWRRRNNDAAYMQSLNDDPALKREAELELMCVLAHCQFDSEYGGYYGALDYHRWEHAPRRVVGVTPIAPASNDPTSPVFAVGSTGFAHQAPQPPPPPPVSLVAQCQRRFMHTQERLSEFHQLRARLHGDQQFFEQMKTQATADEQAEIITYIEAIRRAIGDINEAA